MFIVTLHQILWIFILSEGVLFSQTAAAWRVAGKREARPGRIQIDMWERRSCTEKERGRRGDWFINKSMLTPWTSNLSLTWWRHSPVCIFKIFLSKRVFIIVLLIVLSSQRMIKEEWEAQQRKEQEEKEQKQKEKRDREVKRALGG